MFKHPSAGKDKPAIQTTRADKPAQPMQGALLDIGDIFALQQTIGNQATMRLLRKKQARDTLLQRRYVGDLIDYDTMRDEKDAGQIRTGGAKIGGTLTKRVQKFRSLLADQSTKTKDLKSALQDILDRLVSDQKAKLKAPKGVENWDKAAATIAATAFYTKWINIVQAHLTYVNQNQYGISAVIGMRQAYRIGLPPAKVIEVDMNHGAVATNEDVVFTEHLTECAAVVILAGYDPHFGTYDYRALAHLGGGNPNNVQAVSPQEANAVKQIAQENGAIAYLILGESYKTQTSIDVIYGGIASYFGIAPQVMPGKSLTVRVNPDGGIIYENRVLSS